MCPAPGMLRNPCSGGGQCAVHGQLEWMDLEIPKNNWSRRHERNSPSARRAARPSLAVGPALVTAVGVASATPWVMPAGGLCGQEANGTGAAR